MQTISHNSVLTVGVADSGGSSNFKAMDGSYWAGGTSGIPEYQSHIYTVHGYSRWRWGNHSDDALGLPQLQSRNLYYESLSGNIYSMFMLPSELGERAWCEKRPGESF